MKNLKYYIIAIVAIMTVSCNPAAAKDLDGFYIDSLHSSYHFNHRHLNERHNGVGVSFFDGSMRYALGGYLNSYEKNSKYVGVGRTLWVSRYIDVGAGLTVANNYRPNKHSFNGLVSAPSINVVFKLINNKILSTGLIAPTVAAIQFSVKL